MHRRAPSHRLAATLLAAALLAACGGGDGPNAPTRPGPSVRVVAGGGITDTVDARVPQAIVVEVRDSAGLPLPNAVVHFEGERLTIAGMSLPGVYVCPLTTPVCGDDPSQINGGGHAWTGPTDATGRVRSTVRFGKFAGPRSVRVSVPELGLEARAAYTLQAGAADAVVLAADDTTILVGATLPSAARVVDRYGNARAEVPQLTTSDADLRLAGTMITATELVEGWVVARSGTMVDSLHVRAVPAGRLVVWWQPQGSVVLVNLDGTESRSLMSMIGSSYGAFPRFSASKARVALHRGSMGWAGEPNGLVAIDTTGGGRLELAPPGLTQLTQVREAADGAYLFVARPTSAAGQPTRRASLWRMTPDGVATPVIEIPDYAESVIGGFGGADLSADGRRLVYIAKPGTAFGAPTPVRVLDLASGAVTTIAPNGISPRWSPDGERVAFIVNPDGASNSQSGRLYVAAADGSGARVVGTRTVSTGVAWSPDGRYLVVRSDTESALRVFESDGSRTVALRLGVTVGQDYPVFVRRDYYQPDWR